MNLRPRIRSFMRDLKKRFIRAQLGSPAAVPTHIVTEDFGYSRGTPIDRKFIEGFIAAKAACIRGSVLEVGEPYYTRAYGSGIQHVDVLHRFTGNPVATIVGDLQKSYTLEPGRYDCVILTQVLNFLSDPRAALATAWHSLRPGGTMLLSVACLSPISIYDRERWGDYWRITEQGLETLVGELKPLKYEIRAYGSIALAISFLRGCAYEDIPENERMPKDGDRFPIVICAFLEKTN